jgi:hypothetical protein
MSNGTTDPWSDREAKRIAILKVLRHVAKNPAEGEECVGNDEKAHALFKRVAQMDIPKDKGGRAIFFAPGEKTSEEASSVIIELPPPQPEGAPEPTDDELLKFVLGNYVHWADETDPEGQPT